MQTVFPKEWKPLTQLPIKSQAGILIPKTKYCWQSASHRKKNKRLQKLGHRSSQHCDIGVSESYIMTNKGAALKYEHICSRDLDSRLSWLRVLHQPSSTSQTHLKSKIANVSCKSSLQLQMVLRMFSEFFFLYWLLPYVMAASNTRVVLTLQIHINKHTKECTKSTFELKVQ